MRRLFILAALTILAVSLSIQTAPVQTVLAGQFPKNQATNANTDTHLMLTFSRPPSVGRSGEIGVYDAAAGSIVDRIDMAIPDGPGGRGARGVTAAGTTPQLYQKAVIGSHTQTLEIASFQSADVGRYVAVATNASGRAESEPANISIANK